MLQRRNLANPGELLLIRGNTSFLIAGKPARQFPLCIETCDGEYIQGIGSDDIVAVSAPEGGPLEPAIMLLELVRSYQLPLIVLPHGHKGIGRLRYVVSAGPRIVLSCSIQRGTHPEQHLLCASGELSGIEISGVKDGVELDWVPESVVISTIQALKQDSTDDICD